MNWQDVPVFIINRNRLTCTKQLVDWLYDAGSNKITIIDNKSSYQPLLNYYADVPVDYDGKVAVKLMDKNYGPWVFWDNSMGLETTYPYVVSDSDCVPDKGCPKDLIGKMIEVFDRTPNCQKVGPGLRIDNLPEHYVKKKSVIEHELQFSLDGHLQPEGDCYEALIDTTMALYATPHFPGWQKHYRLAPPYVVEHTPWYEDSYNLTEEQQFYKASVENNWSCWL